MQINHTNNRPNKQNWISFDKKLLKLDGKSYFVICSPFFTFPCIKTQKYQQLLETLIQKTPCAVCSRVHTRCTPAGLADRDARRWFWSHGNWHTACYHFVQPSRHWSLGALWSPRRPEIRRCRCSASNWGRHMQTMMILCWAIGAVELMPCWTVDGVMLLARCQTGVPDQTVFVSEGHHLRYRVKWWYQTSFLEMLGKVAAQPKV